MDIRKQLKDPSLFHELALIHGEWVQASAKETFSVDNPATGQVIGHVPNMGAVEAEQAISSAQKAWGEWKALAGKERAQILERWYELMLQNADDLARIMTLEQGKPLAEAKGEVMYAASFIQWFAAEALRVSGDVLASPLRDKRVIVLKQPIGVSACITPWNFPAAMITRKAGPALAAGCPMVIKPAEATPFSALALADLALRAGVPAGILNVVTGKPAEIGEVFTSSPVVRKLSFTGSTQVGRKLMAQCAPTVKKLSLELGGNAPFIVFADADISEAVKSAVTAKFRNAGQTCISPNRFYVHRSVVQSFVSQLSTEVAKLKVGNGLEEGVVVGPLINQAAISKVESLLQDAIAHGAELICGGQRIGGPDSLFFEPTIIRQIQPNMRICSEEIFGPVIAITEFETLDDVVHYANDTVYGLAAYFFSRDIGQVWHVAEALEYGMVGINTGVISNEVSPFGGVKQSGIGREGSKYGIDEYLVLKTLTFGL